MVMLVIAWLPIDPEIGRRQNNVPYAHIYFIGSLL